MKSASVLDALLAQTWQHAIANLRHYLKKEHLLALTSTWVVSALLRAGISRREPEIRDYLVLLDNWARQLETDVMLTESSSALLSLWIYLRRQRRTRVADHLKSLFLRSVEHNLQKPKDLSLCTNVDLLTAVAAGLEGTSPPASLREGISQCLQTLSQNADAQELVQLLQAWEFIQRIDDIPQLDINHKLESIVAEEDNPIIERTMAYYGQFRLASLFSIPNVEYEIQFLRCLGTAASSSQGMGDSSIKAYVSCLPYLTERMSYNSLSNAWQGYMDSSFKRAKTENHLTRYFLVWIGFGVACIFFLPWFQRLDVGYQISIATAASTVLLMATAYTFEVTFELHGHQFWQKGKWEIFIGSLGAAITLLAAILSALLK